MGKGITVTHNGYKIEYCQTMEEAERIMHSVINEHLNLSPKKIFDRTIPGNNDTGHTKMRIVRFRYYTLYEETFTIDFD